MKYLLLLGIFFSSLSFADTVNCFTKEEPYHGKMINQNFSANTQGDGEAAIDGVSKADPKISFTVGGDTRGIWVIVTDARSGVSARNQDSRPSVGTNGVATQIYIPSVGEYSIFCTATPT